MEELKKKGMDEFDLVIKTINELDEYLYNIDTCFINPNAKNVVSIVI